MFNDYKMNGPWRAWVTPNEPTDYRTRWALTTVWVLIAMWAWEVWRAPIFPSGEQILAALPELWARDGLGAALVSSFRVNAEALLLSSAASLGLAYVCRVPAMRPPVAALTKLRFLSPAVFFLILLFAAPTAHALKVLMLAAGETFFLLTMMVNVVDAIPLARYDDARTLRMNEWQVTWYVVVRGTAVEAVDAIRDNAAMGWSMLMMVEGLVRSEGGVGVLLLNQEKYFNFAHVYAIALSILVVGLVQDWGLGALRDGLLPYARLNRGGR